MAPTITIIATACACSFGYVVLQWTRKNPKSNNLPPGPKQELFIGSARSFPKDNWHEAFTKWQEVYGDVIYCNLLGQHIVILNSLEAADELLNKRSSSTSARAYTRMTMKLMEWDWVMPFEQPGPHHAEGRKLLRKVIGPQAMPKHEPLVATETGNLLRHLSNFSGAPLEVITSAVGAIVVKLTYGEELYQSYGKELTEVNTQALGLLLDNITKFWLVDQISFLQYVPSWFPGAGFQHIAQKSRGLLEKVRYWPFELAINSYGTGGAAGSLIADCFEEFGQTEAVRDTLAVLYIGGVDTTIASILIFLHLMLLHPRVQKEVQAEMDKLVGQDRLVTMKDRAHLPYLEAAWKEAMRIHVPSPLGFPHVCSRDEVWNGMLIPEGTIIQTNIGFMLTDPRIWGDASTFRPERFLEPDAASLPNPAILMFGFGQRICPGRYLADKAAVQMVSAILQVFELLPVPGEEVPPLAEFVDSNISTPRNFRCLFKPRSEQLSQLIAHA